MEIKEKVFENYTTLIPVGEIDASSSMDMDAMIWKMIDHQRFNIHIDCSELQYISSAGLGVFISFLEELKTGGGKFVFSGMSESVYKTFSLLGLQQILSIVNTADEAAAEFEV
ncbi:MAG: STAS domain-containing protein [Bacteroidia bacterium]|nr:STAS domain-containing protein [Bacteroidia bacterium]